MILRAPAVSRTQRPDFGNPGEDPLPGASVIPVLKISHRPASFPVMLELLYPAALDGEPGEQSDSASDAQDQPDGVNR